MKKGDFTFCDGEDILFTEIDFISGLRQEKKRGKQDNGNGGVYNQPMSGV